VRNVTPALVALALAVPAGGGILDAVLSRPKAQALDPAQFGGLTHLIVVAGATDYKVPQEEILGRVESGLRQSGCWKLLGHLDVAQRVHYAGLKAPSPLDWDDEAQVSSVLLENLPERDERLGVLVFWVTDWRGAAYSTEGGYGREALAQVFDSATGDQVWRGHMLIPEDAAGADARVADADAARREDRALSEYDLFAQFFIDNLRRPANMESACRPLSEPGSRAAPMSDKVKEVADPVLRAAAGLRSPSASVRAQAARTLGQTGDDAAVRPLIQALSDPALEVRAYALDALGEIGSPDAVDPVAARLSDQSKLLRALAARALGRMGSPRAAPALEKLLEAEDEPVVRQAAQAALQKVGPVASMMSGSLGGGVGRP